MELHNELIITLVLLKYMQHQPVITIFSFGFQQQEDILSHSCCALFYWPAVARSGL